MNVNTKMVCRITKINYMALVVSLLHIFGFPSSAIIFLTSSSLAVTICPGSGTTKNEVMPPINVLHLMPVGLLSFIQGKTFVLCAFHTLVGALLPLFYFLI